MGFQVNGGFAALAASGTGTTGKLTLWSNGAGGVLGDSTLQSFSPSVQLDCNTNNADGFYVVQSGNGSITASVIESGCGNVFIDLYAQASNYVSSNQYIANGCTLESFGPAGLSISAIDTVPGNATIMFWVDSVKLATLSGSGIFALTGSSGYLDLSSIAAGSDNLKITATNAVPSVTWSSNSGTHINSTAPAGYLQINVGGSARYIPFWA